MSRRILLDTGYYWPGYREPFNGQHDRLRAVRALIEQFEPDAFIETGTFVGSTTRFFCGNGIPVYTAEIKRTFWILARLRLGWGPKRPPITGIRERCSSNSPRKPRSSDHSPISTRTGAKTGRCRTRSSCCVAAGTTCSWSSTTSRWMMTPATSATRRRCRSIRSHFRPPPRQRFRRPGHRARQKPPTAPCTSRKDHPPGTRSSARSNGACSGEARGDSGSRLAAEAVSGNAAALSRYAPAARYP